MMAASNSMHAEPATAVGIEFGIHGPCHVLATGCSAGLDAAGLAMWMLDSGIAPRALVIAVDLPLVPSLLDAYAASGILSGNNINDPYSPQSTGMLPSEAAVALAMEAGPLPGHPAIIAHHSNSDAWRPTGVPPDGAMMAALIGKAVAAIGRPAALCPHASGTKALAAAEPVALRTAFAEPPPLVILKPLIGHAVAAGGLLEAAMVAASLQQRRLPASAPGLTPPPGIPVHQSAASADGPVIKLASGLGGHNSLLAIAPPPA
jgi:3-oxoacyl-[acyl-carrier-protein] synthase II